MPSTGSAPKSTGLRGDQASRDNLLPSIHTALYRYCAPLAPDYAPIIGHVATGEHVQPRLSVNTYGGWNKAASRHSSLQRVSRAPSSIRAGCVNTSKAPSRATAIRVIPQASAVRTASAVGAEIAAMTGEPIRAAF